MGRFRPNTRRTNLIPLPCPLPAAVDPVGSLLTRDAAVRRRGFFTGAVTADAAAASSSGRSVPSSAHHCSSSDTAGAATG